VITQVETTCVTDWGGFCKDEEDGFDKIVKNMGILGVIVISGYLPRKKMVKGRGAMPSKVLTVRFWHNQTEFT